MYQFLTSSIYCRDGVLNEEEFHNLCCELSMVDGGDHVMSTRDYLAMLGLLGGKEVTVEPI